MYYVVITCGRHKGARGRLQWGSGEYAVEGRERMPSRIKLETGAILETADYVFPETADPETFGALLTTEYARPQFKAEKAPEETIEFSQIVAKIKAELGDYKAPEAATIKYKALNVKSEYGSAGGKPYLIGYTLTISTGVNQIDVYHNIKTLTIKCNGEQNTLREFIRRYRASRFARFVVAKLFKIDGRLGASFNVGTNYKV